MNEEDYKKKITYQKWNDFRYQPTTIIEWQQTQYEHVSWTENGEHLNGTRPAEKMQGRKTQMNTETNLTVGWKGKKTWNWAKMKSKCLKCRVFSEISLHHVAEINQLNVPN
jgi:hypothetical protein